METINFEAVQKTANNIRKRVLEHTVKNNGGYLSQACSAAEIVAALYSGLVKLNPLPAPLAPELFKGVPSRNFSDYQTGAVFNGTQSPEADRLIISPAHYALVIYTALIETKRLREDGLDFFNKDGYSVEMIGAEHSPGFETTTGSLAQALSQAGGIALARKLKKETGKVWVFMSDGEFQEGQTWEALAAINYHGLDNVKIIVDVNRNQCDGPMDSVMTIEPLAQRIKSFGWQVDVIDGHNLREMYAAGSKQTLKPQAILAYTDPMKNIEILKERLPVLHYVRFSSEAEREKYQDFYKAWSL
ncbi:MAG: 1-deoxy-D-xylulose-5-phosphate synthase N-terminal domain-containing protein [Candidatus Nanopelagicales bacterium]|jgi:transketolase